MVREIFWTDIAKLSVKIIFNYYKENVDIIIAERIKFQIFEKVKILKTHPLIGAKEDLLSNLKNKYKYIVSGNYKIIYFTADKRIIISLVFDTRQNPQKLQDIIKKIK